MGIKYKDGILLASDCAVSYGSMKKVKGATRVSLVGEEGAFVCSGEMGDF